MTDRLALVLDEGRAERLAQSREACFGPAVIREGSPQLERLAFRVLGVSSPKDIRALRRRLLAIDGVHGVRLREEGQGVVSVVDGRLTASELGHIIRSLGLECHLPELKADLTEQRVGIRALLTVVPALLVVLAAVLTRDFGYGSALVRRVSTNVEFILTALVWWAGRSLVMEAAAGWTARSAAREVPLALAAVLASIASLWGFFTQTEPYFDVAVTLVAGYHACVWIESVFKWRVSSHLRLLQGVWPAWAHVERDGVSYQVAPADVLDDDVVLAQPGILAVDGVLLEGSSSVVVDEQLLTGETTRVQKSAGDPVLAGSTIIGDDDAISVRIKPVSVGRETLLGQLISVLVDAGETRAPVQRRGDQIAAAMTPLSLAVALATAVGWELMDPLASFWTIIGPAVAVLVAMAPWGISVASLTPVLGALSAAARNGVVLRSAETVESLQAVEAVVFARSGVLTAGQPEVEQFEVVGLSERAAMAFVVALESRADGPVSAAVLAYADAHYPGLDLPETTAFRAIPGQGLMARVADQEVALGTRELADARGSVVPEGGGEPGMWLYLVVDGVVTARLRLYDPVRSDAATSMARMGAHAVRPFLVSANTVAEVAYVAEHAGIAADDVRGGIDGSTQSDVARVLSVAGLRVGTVRPANPDASERASVRMPKAGNDDESVEVTLLGSPPTALASAIDISHMAFDLIRENLALGVLYLGAGIPAALGMLSPQVAVGLLILTVTLSGLNGLRVVGAGR
ncbi:MAG: Cu+-exporting ATPase [Myxococcota bacterium]